MSEGNWDDFEFVHSEDTVSVGERARAAAPAEEELSDAPPPAEENSFTDMVEGVLDEVRKDIPQERREHRRERIQADRERMQEVRQGTRRSATPDGAPPPDEFAGTEDESVFGFFADGQEFGFEPSSPEEVQEAMNRSIAGQQQGQAPQPPGEVPPPADTVGGAGQEMAELLQLVRKIVDLMQKADANKIELARFGP